MKKIALIIVLVLVVAAGALSAGVASGGGSGPTVTVTPTSGPAGTLVSVSGSRWTPGIVTLYMDSVDSTHLLATATANGIGYFFVNFKMTATTVGTHNVIGTQPAGQASAAFTLTVTEPLDERTSGNLCGVMMEGHSGSLELDDQSANVLWEIYPGVRHISLTLGAFGLEPAYGDWLLVVVRTGPSGGLFLVDLHEDDVVAVEFDAAEWTLGAGDGGGNPVHADYFWTVTYPVS